MATVKLTFSGMVNTSLQAKVAALESQTASVDNGAWDVIYFTRIDSTTGKQSGDVYRLGKCIGISSEGNSYSISVEPDPTAQTPDSNDYVFFGKENKINISGVRGFFAEVEMKNDSDKAARLFSVGSEISPSSK